MIFLPRWPKTRGWVKTDPHSQFPLEPFVVYIHEHKDRISRITNLWIKYIDNDNVVNTYYESRSRNDDSINVLEMVREYWPEIK
jgi:hypothetical protein